MAARLKVRPVVNSVLYRVRDLRSRRLFTAIDRHATGVIVDVGGGNFFDSVKDRGFPYAAWVVVEPGGSLRPGSKALFLQGDGCRLGVRSDCADTVLSVQVLEHVFEPMAMVSELNRILKPGGTAILLVPTTATMHLAPHYFYNFSRYWIFEALRRERLEIVEFHELGGIWSSMASHLVYFFLQAARFPGMTDPAIRRSPGFWLMLPAQVLVAVVCLPICLLLALADLQEEPNNHLVVARKPSS